MKKTLLFFMGMILTFFCDASTRRSHKINHSPATYTTAVATTFMNSCLKGMKQKSPSPTSITRRIICDQEVVKQQIHSKQCIEPNNDLQLSMLHDVQVQPQQLKLQNPKGSNQSLSSLDSNNSLVNACHPVNSPESEAGLRLRSNSSDIGRSRSSSSTIARRTSNQEKASSLAAVIKQQVFFEKNNQYIIERVESELSIEENGQEVLQRFSNWNLADSHQSLSSLPSWKSNSSFVHDANHPVDSPESDAGSRLRSDSNGIERSRSGSSDWGQHVDAHSSPRKKQSQRQFVGRLIHTLHPTPELGDESPRK